MAFYGDHFATQVSGGVTTTDFQTKSGPNTSGGRLRQKVMNLTTPASGNNQAVLVFGLMKSTDAIHDLFFESDNVGATSHATTIGLYEVGPAGELGAVYDVDCLAAAQATASAVSRAADGVLVAASRHAELWTLKAGVTEDPGGQFYVCGTTSDHAFDNSGNMKLSIVYTSGD
tara:strand:- start:1090 stop:1608 length:519 start_codon:yes stop_codon:yes gene_type:complete